RVGYSFSQGPTVCAIMPLPRRAAEVYAARGAFGKRFRSWAMEDVLCLILGGGRGTRLYPLTKRRSEPAVPVAGKYRLIDIPTGHAPNGGLPRFSAVPQSLSATPHRHIANTYKFDPFSRGFVEILAAQQTNEAAGWFEGTADALRQNLPHIQEEAAD